LNKSKKSLESEEDFSGWVTYHKKLEPQALEDFIDDFYNSQEGYEEEPNENPEEEDDEDFHDQS